MAKLFVFRIEYLLFVISTHQHGREVPGNNGGHYSIWLPDHHVQMVGAIDRGLPICEFNKAREIVRDIPPFLDVTLGQGDGFSHAHRVELWAYVC